MESKSEWVDEGGSRCEPECDSVAPRASEPVGATIGGEPRFGQLASDVHRDHRESVKPATMQVRPDSEYRNEQQLSPRPLGFQKKESDRRPGNREKVRSREPVRRCEGKAQQSGGKRPAGIG